MLPLNVSVLVFIFLCKYRIGYLNFSPILKSWISTINKICDAIWKGHLEVSSWLYLLNEKRIAKFLLWEVVSGLFCRAWDFFRFVKSSALPAYVDLLIQAEWSCEKLLAWIHLLLLNGYNLSPRNRLSLSPFEFLIRSINK